MPKDQTSKRSSLIEGTGVDRLYKRVGVRKISFFYQYPDGKRETLATATKGDRQATAEAERTAKRKALDMQEGKIVVGSVAAMIDRFEEEIAPTHYLDQSKDGIAVRKSAYGNLRKFFGGMLPTALKTVHGYQFLDARAKVGAAIKANKEMAQMSTICNYAVRWGVMEANPFTGMMQNKQDKVVRVTSRSQVVRFYLWSLKQAPGTQIFGCAGMFTYLTGFRAAEVRPFHVSGLSDKDGVRVISAKRKKGQAVVGKLRKWSRKLRVVVARAKQAHKAQRMYLFANSSGKPYSRSGWGSMWTDTMFEWIATFDQDAAMALIAKRAWEIEYKAAYDAGKTIDKFETDFKITAHPAYFTLMDVRPAAITKKLDQGKADAFDFAAHANPATTLKDYDRRQVKKANATE